MPSASAKVDKAIDSTMDPFKQSMKFVEHKIRNLEKRKAKLDVYKKDQQDGKELNADQLAAVAKFTEVVQQLEFSRDFLKQLTQLNDDNDKALKKQQRQQKAELNERLVEQQKNYENLLIFQGILKTMAQEEGRELLLDSNFCYPLSEDDLKSLTEFKNLVDPGSPNNADFLTVAAGAGEKYSQLFEGSTKVAVNGRTFREIRTMLIAIRKSNFLSSLLNIEKENSAKETQTTPVKKEIVESPKQPLPLMNTIQSERPSSPRVMLGSGYNFLQDSRIDISPHMDPAVVAVSSVAPLMPQRIPNYDNAFPERTGFDNNKYDCQPIRVNLRVDRRTNSTKSKKKAEKIEEWNKTNEGPAAGKNWMMKPEGGEWPYPNKNEPKPDSAKEWVYPDKEVSKTEMEEWSAPQEPSVPIPVVKKEDWATATDNVVDNGNGRDEWQETTTEGVSVNGMEKWSNVTQTSAPIDDATFQGSQAPAKNETEPILEDWVTPPSPTDGEWGGTFNIKGRTDEETEGNQWNPIAPSAANGGNAISVGGSYSKRRNSKPSSRSRGRGIHNGYGRDQTRDHNRDYNRDQQRDYSRGDYNNRSGEYNRDANFLRDQNLQARPRDSGYSNGRSGGNFHEQDQRFDQEHLEVGEYKRGNGNFRGGYRGASIRGEHTYSRGSGDYRSPRGCFRGHNNIIY